MGFIGREPGMNPCRSCPHCLAGTPYPVHDRFVCSLCRGEVDVSYLLLWRCDLEAFLGWLIYEQWLLSNFERLDDGLWRLGTLEGEAQVTECFFLRGEGLSDLARRRLAAFRSVLIVHGKAERPDVPGFDGRVVSLLDVLGVEGDRITARPLRSLLSRGGAVGFDRRTGSLTAGGDFLGRIPPDTREFYLLAFLADRPGETVPYSDLKRYVCQMAGSQDETDEATFCQKMKSRIKRDHGVEGIDGVVRTDRRGGGYVLVPEVALRNR